MISGETPAAEWTPSRPASIKANAAYGCAVATVTLNGAPQSGWIEANARYGWIDFPCHDGKGRPTGTTERRRGTVEIYR